MRLHGVGNSWKLSRSSTLHSISTAKYLKAEYKNEDDKKDSEPDNYEDLG